VQPGVPRLGQQRRKQGEDMARATALRDEHRPGPARLAAALAPEVLALLALHPVRELVTVAGPYGLKVERRRALVGSWYEFFPRSEGAIHHEDGSWTSGTFDTAIPRLEAAATMGFDVVYLPPIHPIGQGFRKGPNNTLNPGPHDPGVPWAIGSSDGGHDTVHPNLGGMAAFDRFMARAEELGVDIALDLALQVSPDHPWVSEHPDWFSMRVDGSIAYAENPPKKYQDIYPINFDHDPQGIFNEVMRIVKLWISHGVRIFRVDNPHTKPVAFWERLFRELAATNPDVLFLAEAFTRPPMMAALGKAGFHQSYTYFTWRNSRWELEEYLTELSGLSGAFMRPNLFTNTPDILSGYLVEGGRSAFLIRSLLAATLSPTWGIYAGFELCENAPLRPGSEEYLDSEKYQYRPRDWAAASEQGHSIAGWLTMLNRIRASHVSLQRLRNLTFHHADDDSVLVFSKTDTGPDGSVDTVLVICLLDPHNTHETLVRLDMPSLGLDWHASFIAEDHISGEQWTWGVTPWVRLSPDHPAHVVSVRR